VTSWLLPLAVVAGSLVLTYVCCLRPMRRGRTPMGIAQSSDAACCRGPADTNLDRAVKQASAKLEQLRAEQAQQASLGAPTASNPPDARAREPH
jgi:hypothetical protein